MKSLLTRPMTSFSAAVNVVLTERDALEVGELVSVGEALVLPVLPHVDVHREILRRDTEGNTSIRGIPNEHLQQVAFQIQARVDPGDETGTWLSEKASPLPRRSRAATPKTYIFTCQSWTPQRGLHPKSLPEPRSDSGGAGLTPNPGCPSNLASESKFCPPPHDLVLSPTLVVRSLGSQCCYSPWYRPRWSRSC